MAGPTMSRHESRERAERVFFARAAMKVPWREIMRNEGFASVGAVQQTYKRESARRRLPPRELAVMTAQEILERRSVTTRMAMAQLMDCRRAGDVTGMAAMLREIRNEDVETAKMVGAYAPQRAEVDVTVADDRLAVIGRLEQELLALAASQPPQAALTANIIDVEEIEEPA